MEQEYCNTCERELEPDRIVWLELDTYTGIYHDPESFPEDGLSQGMFAFGADCAKREGPK